MTNIVCLYCRCYTSPEKKEQDKLKSAFLVDEEERRLRSLQDYIDTWENMKSTCPAIEEYLKTNLMVTTGDWPTWYFQKKIIAKVKRTKL